MQASSDITNLKQYQASSNLTFLIAVKFKARVDRDGKNSRLPETVRKIFQEVYDIFSSPRKHKLTLDKCIKSEPC